MEDEDTESSSDDCYSQIESNNYGVGIEQPQRILNKYQTWLIERCNFQSKWSWLLSEIQSTEFRLKHLRKYSDEIKHLKRKYCSKNDLSTDENSRNKYSRLEKRKRVQIHNLLLADLIKFVSPLYSSDDNSSDKFVQCRCRLGDTGPCILCCGMKNRVAELHNDLYDREDIAKASNLDNSIHTKLSNINDVRNQMKRNVLFNGYIKSLGPHWSYPRARSSLSPLLSAPPQPPEISEMTHKTEPVNLEFSGISLDKKEYKIDFANEYFNKTDNDYLMNHSSIDKIEIKLPSWTQIDDALRHADDNDGIVESHSRMATGFHAMKNATGEEDMDDELYIKRHELEETLERRRNCPLNKATNSQADLAVRTNYFHGYEYKQNSEQSFDLRLFPLLSDEFKQLTHLSKNYLHRSKRFKKRIKKF